MNSKNLVFQLMLTLAWKWISTSLVILNGICFHVINFRLSSSNLILNESNQNYTNRIQSLFNFKTLNLRTLNS